MTVDPHDTNAERDTHISQIASQLMKGRVGFLIGAGMSIPSGGLSGHQLAFQLVWKSLFQHHHEPLPPDFKKELEEVAAKFPLEAVAEGAIPYLGFEQWDLQELLKESVFGNKTPAINDGHRALAAIVAKLRIRMLFTTNWDELLKEALSESAETITERRFRELDKVLDIGKTAIVHLHGTFADDPLVKESDLMDPDRPLFQIFLGELMTKIFVFVGYSLGDPNIRSLYFKSADILKQRSEKLRKTTYVVAPPSSDVDRRLSEAVWRARHATYIPMSGEDFFQALYKETVTHALDGLKKRLRERLDVSAEDLQVKVDEIINVFPSFEAPEQVLFYLDAITRGSRA